PSASTSNNHHERHPLVTVRQISLAGQSVGGGMKRLHFRSLFFTSVAFTLVVLALTAPIIHFNPIEVETAEAEDQGGGEDWFCEQRGYRAGSMPPAARLRAIAETDQQAAARRAQQARFAAADEEAALAEPRWTPLGPQPIAQGQTFGTPRVAVAG